MACLILVFGPRNVFLKATVRVMLILLEGIAVQLKF
jgi:hypothetical protein